MEEPKLSDSELYSIFEKCGWYKGRDLNIEIKLPVEFGEFPEKVIEFLNEFSGLILKHEFEVKFENNREIEIIKTEVAITPGLAEGENAEDGSYRYYTNILGRQLYPIGMSEHSHMALDADLNMYVFELGFGCLRMSDNPIDGLRKMLINDNYTEVYELREYDKGDWEWRKRKSD